MATPTTQDLKLWSAYAVLGVFSISALILIGIIIHLIYIAKRNRSTRRAGAKNKKNNKQMLVMIWITLIGIISFEISLLLIISLVIQIIMMKINSDNINNNLLDKYYDSSFQIVQTFITIFDNFGHLAMITVFIIRLKRCFKDSMFGFSKKLLRFLYGCLIILAIFSFGIDIQTAINSYSNNDIVATIITQMVWEIFIECMDLCLLFLFISKLSQLIVISLNEDELSSIITHIISSKKNRKPSIPEPTENVRVFSIESETEKVNVNADTNTNTKNEMTVDEQEKQIIYLVNMMTKMTVLVIIAVFVSFISLIGNKIIKANELKIVKEHIPNIQQIWLFILPVMDMVITSICLLYLPFNFTKKIYKKLCIKLDVLFLKRMIGKILIHQIKHSSDNHGVVHTKHDGEEATNVVR